MLKFFDGKGGLGQGLVMLNREIENLNALSRVAISRVGMANNTTEHMKNKANKAAVVADKATVIDKVVSARGKYVAGKYGVHYVKGGFSARESQIVEFKATARVKFNDGREFDVMAAKGEACIYVALAADKCTATVHSLELVHNIQQAKAHTVTLVKWLDEKHAIALGVICKAKRAAVEGYTGAVYSSNEDAKAARLFAYRGNDLLVKE